MVVIKKTINNKCWIKCGEKGTLIQLLLKTDDVTMLDSILKSKDITLPTKVRLVKAMVFPVVDRKSVV